MYILPHADFSVLLGLPWFYATRCAINPAEKTIKFNSETYSLDDQISIFNPEMEETVFLTEVDALDPDDIDILPDWEHTGFKGIVPVCKLDNDQMSSLVKVSENIRNGFAKDYNDLGKCSILPYKIRLTADEIVYVPPYRRSIVENEEIEKEVTKLLKAGIIEVSDSPYSSPILMVPKKDGTKRMCIDYRKLNAITVPKNLPIPQIKSIFDRISGATWFSAVDLRSGYLQCSMHPDSIKYTAFSTSNNKYAFRFLPFGTRNAVGHFCRIIHMVLGKFEWCQPYLDNKVIIGSSGA